MPRTRFGLDHADLGTASGLPRPTLWHPSDLGIHLLEEA